MKNYIGVKLVKAEEMTLGEYNKLRGWTIPENENPEKEGYRVAYSDDYYSWCPKEVFEKAHFEIKEETTISKEDVDNFIDKFEVSDFDEKTTLVKGTLINKFTIIEHSSCVDPKNYDQSIGAIACNNKIQDKVWMLLGFLLQTARFGVKN